MAWILLVVAGLLEVAWSIGMKYTEGFTRLWPSLFTGAGIVASMLLLSQAAKTLPIGTAYGVWVGIGAAGAAVFGMVVLGSGDRRPHLLRLSAARGRGGPEGDLGSLTVRRPVGGRAPFGGTGPGLRSGASGAPPRLAGTAPGPASPVTYSSSSSVSRAPSVPPGAGVAGGGSSAPGIRRRSKSRGASPPGPRG